MKLVQSLGLRHWRAKKSTVLLIALGMLMVGCGQSDVGEACDDIGKTDECVDGAVCTNEEEGSSCRMVCDEQQDCPVEHTCNGISNSSLKSCQPD